MLSGQEAQEGSDLQANLKVLAAPRHDYFMLRTTEVLLIKGQYSNTYNELYQALLEYIDGNLKLYGAFYNDNAFLGEMEFLPPSCRLAVRLSSVLVQERDCDYKRMLKACRNCLKIYPAMDGVISRYAHLYKEKMEAELEEFAQLREQLKGKVRQLINHNAYKEAGLILDKLKELDPENPDILSLDEMLNSVFTTTDQ